MYKTRGLKSNRDSLKLTEGQKAYELPPPGTCIFVGSTGSGKTSVAGSLLMRPEAGHKPMLYKYFDEIHVFCLSPCTTLIDNVEQIVDEKVYLDDDPTKLEELYEKQKSNIKSLGFKRTPHVLVILDDIVQSKTFLKSKVLTDIFFGGTHSKFSLWILSQNYMSVPRRLRMNTHSMLLFHGVNNTEIERYSDEHQSPYLKKNDFTELVNFALSEPYSFLFLNKTNPDKHKAFRLGFSEGLVIGDGD
tara:strand:- start:937 stop:1674 length:738 start_codon:yes stop_codon:yes gene_type:complete